MSRRAGGPPEAKSLGGLRWCPLERFGSFAQWRAKVALPVLSQARCPCRDHRRLRPILPRHLAQSGNGDRVANQLANPTLFLQLFGICHLSIGRKWAGIGARSASISGKWASIDGKWASIGRKWASIGGKCARGGQRRRPTRERATPLVEWSMVESGNVGRMGKAALKCCFGAGARLQEWI